MEAGLKELVPILLDASPEQIVGLMGLGVLAVAAFAIHAVLKIASGKRHE